MTRKPVSAKDLNKWKVRYVHGDFKKIAWALNLSRTTISNAFKGVATREVILRISKYYNAI